MGTLKHCKHCNQDKPLEAFAKGDGKHGRYHRCKECASIWDKARRTPEMTKQGNLKNHFGLTLADYDWLFQKQHGKCALCFKEIEQGRRFDMDHAHNQHNHLRKAQKGCKDCIRGLLCNYCNCVLGLLEKCPHLQNDLARFYIEQRPFKEQPCP